MSQSAQIGPDVAARSRQCIRQGPWEKTPELFAFWLFLILLVLMMKGGTRYRLVPLLFRFRLQRLATALQELSVLTENGDLVS